MKPIARIAPDVGWLPVSFANVYFIGRPGGKWLLVDAGLPGRANEIVDAAEARFGAVFAAGSDRAHSWPYGSGRVGRRSRGKMGVADLRAPSRNAVPAWTVALSAGRSHRRRRTCVPFSFSSGACARFERARSEVAARQTSRRGGVGMACYAWSFAGSHFAVQKIGSRPSGGRRLHDCEYGFVERTGYWKAKVVASANAVHHRLGSDSFVSKGAGEFATECGRVRPRHSNFRS